MKADGHRLWGSVIYRTTYDSEYDWAEGLARLIHHYEKTFHMSNDHGKDVLGQFWLAVMDE